MEVPTALLFVFESRHVLEAFKDQGQASRRGLMRANKQCQRGPLQTYLCMYQLHNLHHIPGTNPMKEQEKADYFISVHEVFFYLMQQRKRGEMQIDEF